MTLQELIRRFRVSTRDTKLPYLFPDEDVTDWLNDALEQACIRGRLIRDDSTTAVTRIALTSGTHTYSLHESAYELISLRLLRLSGDKPITLKLQSREWMDRNQPEWRDETRNVSDTRTVIQDDTSLRVVGVITTGDVLDLECYRLPLDPLATDVDEPEIHRSHHLHLIQWALHRAYSIPDVEVFDPNRAEQAERAFTRYFGLLPNADMRRMTREDTDHASESVLP